jgi:hypothetical protein
VSDTIEPTTPEVPEVVAPKAVVHDIPTELADGHPHKLSFREQLMRQWPLEYLERRGEE